MKVDSQLKEVPETMLWTLHNRANEAMREDSVIQDDKAIQIYQSINYDYEKSFGKADPSHAIRSLDFDREISAFLDEYPDGTIVNLGEGLETQRFRIDNGKALWLCVDLPESIENREQFIQPDSRHLHIALSALDLTWFENVPKDKPVFISAQGLFMYFTEEQVRSLLQAIEQSFNNWVVLFDTIPAWLSKKTISQGGWQKTPDYKAPPMPWGVNRSQIKQTFSQWLPDHVSVRDIGYSTFPRGIMKWVFLLFTSTPGLKNATPTIVKLESWQ